MTLELKRLVDDLAALELERDELLDLVQLLRGAIARRADITCSCGGALRFRSDAAVDQRAEAGCSTTSTEAMAAGHPGERAA